MNKDEFFEKIKDEVASKINENDNSVEATIAEVSKGNGVLLHGISFKGTSNIQPVIYLDAYYEKHLNGSTIEEIVDNVVNTYYQSRKHRDFDVSMLTSFDNAKNSLVAAVMNAELNENILSDMPHRIFEDLAIYYKVVFDMDDLSVGSVKVTNALLKNWNITEDELHRVAVQNVIDKNDAVCRDIFDVICDAVDDEPELGGLMQDSGMLVLSNKRSSDGAIFIHTEFGQLKKVADAINDDLIVLPSSRNELILLKKAVADERSIDYFREMVKEVNESNVSAEDFLSNSVYFFSRQNNELKIA